MLCLAVQDLGRTLDTRLGASRDLDCHSPPDADMRERCVCIADDIRVFGAWTGSYAQAGILAHAPGRNTCPLPDVMCGRGVSSADAEHAVADGREGTR